MLGETPNLKLKETLLSQIKQANNDVASWQSTVKKFPKDNFAKQKLKEALQRLSIANQNNSMSNEEINSTGFKKYSDVLPYNPITNKTTVKVNQTSTSNNKDNIPNNSMLNFFEVISPYIPYVLIGGVLIFVIYSIQKK